MSFKYDSHDLYIIRRKTETNLKVWTYALVHGMKRRAIFYQWTPGCTAARRISNQMLNDPNTLRQKFVCRITTPHLETFCRVMAINWQAWGADGDREFIVTSLVELERLHLVPDGTQSHWVAVLAPERPTPPTSESSSLPSPGDSSGSSDSSSSSSGNHGTDPSNSATSSRGAGRLSTPVRDSASHPFSSSDSDRLRGRNAKRTRPSDSAPKENRGVKQNPLSQSDRGAKRDRSGLW